MTLRWQRKSFLTSLTLTRRTTNTYSRTRHHWKNPRVREWGWSNPPPPETKRDCIRRVTEAATCWLHFPSPRTAQHHTERSPPSHWFIQWKKRIQEVQPAPPPHCGSLFRSPYSDLTLRICRAQSLGILTVTKKACKNHHVDLGSLSSYLRCPSSNSNQWLCSSAELIRGMLWRNSVGCRSTWFGSSNKEFCQTQNLVCPPPGKVLSHNPIPCGERLPVPSDQKDCDNSWKLCSPAVLKTREEQTDLTVCGTTLVALFGQGTWVVGWLDLRQQRALPVLETLLQLCLSRASNS